VQVHIGIDDTDSPKGGCTTYIAALLVEKFSRMKVRFTDYPNIIRLNPNVPYKTRGNAAVALRFQIPASNIDTVRNMAARTVEANSMIGEPGTDPAIVFVQGKPSRGIIRLSRKALSDIVPVHEASRTLREADGSALSYGGGMGLVGALAAVGQTLETDHTYELIAYRQRENLGKPRRVDRDSVISMDRLTTPHTFSSYDAESSRILITPHGPDPVLLGLRGETATDVRSAFRMLRILEPIERWVIFRTNHGTEAHFSRLASRGTLRINRPVWLRGVVQHPPRRIRGGHVFVSLLASGGAVECAAFEPTGKFKETVASLIPGDEVAVFGGVKLNEAGGGVPTINLEKMIVDRACEDVRVENPNCPECGKRMKSAGRGQGFRCPRCKHASRDASKQLVNRVRTLRAGLYLPVRKAHRHLTKPLFRYGLEKKRWDGKPPLGIWHEP
jgi:tRNA(Ile2)-agmatinylcytidine synthase